MNRSRLFSSSICTDVISWRALESPCMPGFIDLIDLLRCHRNIRAIRVERTTNFDRILKQAFQPAWNFIDAQWPHSARSHLHHARDRPWAAHSQSNTFKCRSVIGKDLSRQASSSSRVSGRFLARIIEDYTQALLIVDYDRILIWMTRERATSGCLTRVLRQHWDV